MSVISFYSHKLFSRFSTNHHEKTREKKGASRRATIGNVCLCGVVWCGAQRGKETSHVNSVLNRNGRLCCTSIHFSLYALRHSNIYHTHTGTFTSLLPVGVKTVALVCCAVLYVCNLVLYSYKLSVYAICVLFIRCTPLFV